MGNLYTNIEPVAPALTAYREAKARVITEAQGGAQNVTSAATTELRKAAFALAEIVDAEDRRL